MSNPPDLWPGDIGFPRFRAPAAILAEQAALLGQKTNNVVSGEVIALKSPSPVSVGFAFNLVAPALNNYRVRLLSIWHNVAKLYPVKIEPSLEAMLHRVKVADAKNEQELMETLKEVFAKESTVTAVNSLRVHSENFPVRQEGDEGNVGST